MRQQPAAPPLNLPYGEDGIIPRSRALMVLPPPPRGLTRLRLALAQRMRVVRWGMAGVARSAGSRGSRLIRLPVVLVAGLALLVATAAEAVVRGLLMLVGGLLRAVAGTVRGAARLVASTGRGSGRLAALLVLGVGRLLGLLARGVVAVAGVVIIPVVGLVTATARWTGASVAACARGIAFAATFTAKLLGRAARATGRGVAATVQAAGRTVVLAGRGSVAAVRLLLLALVYAVRLLLRATIVVARYAGALLLKGLRSVLRVVAATGRAIGRGLAVVARGAAAGGIAAARAGGTAAGSGARLLGGTLLTRVPWRAAILPVVPLAALAAAEASTAGLFISPATIGLILLGATACLLLAQRHTRGIAVLCTWLLAVLCIWHVGRGLEGPLGVRVIGYLIVLAAFRTVYVAARSFIHASRLARRTSEQARAHRRAGLAIALVLAGQYAAYVLWAVYGVRPLPDLCLFGELFLVGAGVLLAWSVRGGRGVRAAQLVLGTATLATLVGAIAAQFAAIGAGLAYSTASVLLGSLMLLLALALMVVVHARLIDLEHGRRG